MSDIVKKLRDVAAMDIRVSFLAHTMDTAKEAADEIERLQRENAFLLDRLEAIEESVEPIREILAQHGADKTH